MLSFTVSHTQLAHLGIPADYAIEQAFLLKPRYIRMGLYWSLIEKAPGTYDFSSIEPALKQCETAGQNVVLTVGVKAPRWPEFYWPHHIQGTSLDTHTAQQALLRYIETAIQHLGRYHCITHWQVENEPLDPSGPDSRTIPEDVLRMEVELVRSTDPRRRPCVITVWGNDYAVRKTVEKASALAEIVGLDLYYTQFAGIQNGRSRYRAPSTGESRMRSDMARAAKPVWITELQAEPWEQNDTVYRSTHTPSMRPSLIAEYIVKAERLASQEIFLWGYEYWLWKKLRGDTSYWDAASSAILGR